MKIDPVKEVEDALKEIEKWNQFEARRVARELRRKIKNATKSDERRQIINEQHHSDLAKRQQRLALNLEVKLAKRKAKRIANRMAIIPKNGKCPICKCVKLRNKQWVLTNNSAVCKVCHLASKQLGKDSINDTAMPNRLVIESTNK